jgi:predicted nucleotidyltransferase
MEKSIIKALAYFNIFNYPLRKDEIYNFLDVGCEKNCFEKAINSLFEEGVIYRLDEFYSLQKNISLAECRKTGNQRAVGQLKIAGRVSRFLYRFPFVKGIAVSGSLSKNYADKKSDIDLFIITKANRLWLARTLMHLFKKLTFLTGRQHWFCMNYYIDEQALEIKEKNIFTAMEIMTVLPLHGNGVFKAFFAANKWTKNFFPVYQSGINAAEKTRKGIFTLVAEKIFDNRIGDKLNDRLMRITLKRWKKKAEQHRRSHSGELMGLDGGRHYAKPDPANFQKKILYRYEKEVEAFMMRLENVSTV